MELLKSRMLFLMGKITCKPRKQNRSLMFLVHISGEEVESFTLFFLDSSRSTATAVLGSSFSGTGPAKPLLVLDMKSKF